MAMLRLASAAFCVAVGVVVYLAIHVPVVADAELRVLEGFMGLPGHAYANDLVGLFNPAPFAILAGSLVLGAVLARRPRAAAAALVTMLGAGATTQILKPLLAFQRDFPPMHYMGPVAYPSGHTTAVMSLALALIIVSPVRLRPLAAAASTNAPSAAPLRLGLSSSRNAALARQAQPVATSSPPTMSLG